MGVPATLPGDFFDKQTPEKSQAPDTLPENFFDTPRLVASHPQVDLPSFPVDGWLNHQVKDLSPEEQTDKRGKFTSVMYEIAKPWMDAGYEASAGFNRGMAGFALELDSASRFLEHAGLGKSGGLFKGMAEESEANEKVMESLIEKEGVGATDKIFRFLGENVGQAVPGTAQFMLDWASGLTIPYAAGVTEARDRDADPTIGGITKAAQVGMLGMLFNMVAPMKAWIKAGVLGTYFGTEEAIAAKPGERAEGFGKGVATGGLLGITTPGGEYGIRDIYPEIERAAPRTAELLPPEVPPEPIPEGLRPAIQTPEGVKEGVSGETHPDVIERSGIEETKGSERGFVNEEGEFLSRGEAKEWVKDNEPEVYDEWQKIAGDNAPLHAQDYNLARETVEASRRPLPLGSASRLPIDNPPTFQPRTEPTGVWGAIGNVFHRMYKAVTIDVLPELSDAGVSNNAVQHAHARSAVPKIVDDLLSRVFPEDYKNPEKMAPFIDILNKDNILGGYDAFLLNASEARASGDENAAAKWDRLAENVKQVHDLDAYDADVQKAKSNKKFMQIVQRWQDNVSPRLDQLYNEMKQVDTFTQRDSRGRYLDSRINLLTEEAAERWTESLQDLDKPMPEPSASSYRNPNVKRDPTDFMAKFTGEYSKDARAVLSAVVSHRWNEVTKMRFYNDLLDTVAIKAEPGQQAPEGYSRMPFKMAQTDSNGHTSTVEQSIFVPKAMVSEIRSVLGTDMRLKENVVGRILTGIQLTQLADLTTHTKNIMSVVTRAQGAGDVWTDVMRKVPGIGSVDAMWRLAKTTREVLQDTPEIRAEIAQMAQRGLVRPEFPATGIQKITRGQEIIHAADTSARVVMNRFFDNLVERKLVLDTEENRRGFVNQVGEYNSRLEGPIMKAAKQSGLSPFIVAGRNFNRQGRWALTGNPGVEAASLNAAAQMRVTNIVGTAALFTLPMMLNYLTTGKVSGRSGTPIGAWDLGLPPDEKGKHKAIDLLSWTGVRRGMRSIGLDAMARGLMNGDNWNDIAGNALQDAGNTVLHPWNGPAMAFLEKTATGKQFDLRGKMEAEKVPEGGGLQFLENFRAALESQNPLVYSIVRPAFQEVGLDQKIKPGYAQDVVNTLLKSPGQAAGVVDVTPPPSAMERRKRELEISKARARKDAEIEMGEERKERKRRYTILKRRAASGE